MVGRARELSELRAGLADATAGRGSLLLISGEPGIGKTRLSAELATLVKSAEWKCESGIASIAKNPSLICRSLKFSRPVLIALRIRANFSSWSEMKDRSWRA